MVRTRVLKGGGERPSDSGSVLEMGELTSHYRHGGGSAPSCCAFTHRVVKLQYLGHLMWIADSFEKTLMLGKIESQEERG